MGNPNTPAWVAEENTRADKLAEVEETANKKAPRLEKVYREPKRMQKAFYIQEKHARAFEKLAFDQKQGKGKKATELAEEAIEMLLKKYKTKL